MKKKEKKALARKLLSELDYDDLEIAEILGYAFDGKKFTGQTFTEMIAEGAPPNANNPRPETT